MSLICPTILANTPGDFAEQLNIATALSDVSRVQIDITDGDFAKPKTINLNQIYWPDDFRIDLHVMFNYPTKWTEMLVSLSPSLVIIHAEAKGDLVAFIEHLHKFNIKVGVALLPETAVESVRSFIESADHVLLFGGNLGKMGGEALLSNLDKVHEIRKINPNVEIGWDGGVNLENIVEIAQAGVDVINVGSAIQGAEDPVREYGKLKSAII